ncbi:hypothetical protein M569_06102 [Genlisea aurea]|uniref:C2H2-type domain-containing protein n=1 Tax=Genlisea aurea TaxID=192259 RepID=S8E881_9LAMI|nr:hypothetical protein M569_06102 [Genlisea aurea]
MTTSHLSDFPTPVELEVAETLILLRSYTRLENQLPSSSTAAAEVRVYNRKRNTSRNRINSDNAAHTCGTCGMAFPTDQALGGHMTSRQTEPAVDVGWIGTGTAAAKRRSMIRLLGFCIAC